MDIYSDHMVRQYERSFLPLERIDSTGFMIGNTGTIYYRKTNAWQGMLLLMVARGGWINTIHGNLEFLNDQQARWFAKVQSLYAHCRLWGEPRPSVECRERSSLMALVLSTVKEQYLRS
jgi:hypothetical protein